MHLGTWCTVTHYWYQITKEYSTSQERSIIPLARSDSLCTECSNIIEVSWAKYIMILLWLVENFLVHWYQQCETVHHVSKTMKYHQVIGGSVIIGKAQYLSFVLHIYYAHLSSVRFEHSVCHELLLTNLITLLAWLVEHSLAHWYQQCLTLHCVRKWMSYHGAIGEMVITSRAHCHVLGQFPLTTSETELHYYHQDVIIKVVSRVAKQLKF